MTTSAVPLNLIAEHLDAALRTREIPDYAGAVNGVQLEHQGPVRRCAVAVDASVQTIEGAIATGANLLVVHHGLFWAGVQPLRGRLYERLRRLIEHDMAVYASHLPLDLHPTLGNNALLARELRLTADGGFASFQTNPIGLTGASDVETSVLAEHVAAVARREGGHLVRVGVTTGRRTTRWAICTGAGASSDTLREAAAIGVDTLIVGEGPHHTAVEAEELGIAVLYAGHYATETFGVRALGQELERTFGVPWSFVAAPTGL
jgi:dinuclear metal center YbgI/SA1388 family protein